MRCVDLWRWYADSFRLYALSARGVLALIRSSRTWMGAGKSRVRGENGALAGFSSGAVRWSPPKTRLVSHAQACFAAWQAREPSVADVW